MATEKDKNNEGPLTATFVFENKNDALFSLVVTKTPEYGLSETLPALINLSTTRSEIPDARIVAYELPDLNQLPPTNHQNCERYYRDLWKPFLDRTGIKQIYELQAQTIAYAKITGLPIDVRNPEMGIGMREAYAENWGSFTGSILELPGNAVHIILPSEKVVTMTLIEKNDLIQNPVETLQQDYSQKVKGPKHGIS